MNAQDMFWTGATSEWRPKYGKNLVQSPKKDRPEALAKKLYNICVHCTAFWLLIELPERPNVGQLNIQCHQNLPQTGPGMALWRALHCETCFGGIWREIWHVQPGQNTAIYCTGHIFMVYQTRARFGNLHSQK